MKPIRRMAAHRAPSRDEEKEFTYLIHSIWNLSESVMVKLDHLLSAFRPCFLRPNRDDWFQAGEWWFSLDLLVIAEQEKFAGELDRLSDKVIEELRMRWASKASMESWHLRSKMDRSWKLEGSLIPPSLTEYFDRCLSSPSILHQPLSRIQELLVCQYN